MKLEFDKGAILGKYVCVCLSNLSVPSAPSTLGMKLELVKGPILQKYVCVCLSILSVPSAPSAP